VAHEKRANEGGPPGLTVSVLQPPAWRCAPAWAHDFSSSGAGKAL